MKNIFLINVQHIFFNSCAVSDKSGNLNLANLFVFDILLFSMTTLLQLDVYIY